MSVNSKMSVDGKYAYLRPQHGVWLAILGSALFHVGLVAMLVIGGLIRESAANTRDSARITALLRLGKPRPKDWLPRKLPAPATAAPREQRPSRDKNATHDKKTARAAEKKKHQDYSRSMNSALASLTRKEGGKPDDEIEGSPEGVADGDALIAKKGSEYMTKVYKAVKAQYSVPEVIGQRERMFLRATVVITVDAAGRLKDFSFEKHSDNSLFDSAIEAAVRRAAPFPAPPAELAGKYADEGIGLEFSP
ncbi:MAG TPA: TonB family protein [Myxococcota bacterium]|nr:TonB family protein [Myxococcota bacterium]